MDQKATENSGYDKVKKKLNKKYLQKIIEIISPNKRLKLCTK